MFHCTAGTDRTGYLASLTLSILGVDQKNLLKNYGLFGPPAIIILDDRGIEKKSARSVGFISAERLRDLL